MWIQSVLNIEHKKAQKNQVANRYSTQIMLGNPFGSAAIMLSIILTISFMPVQAGQALGHGVSACCWTGFYRSQNDIFWPPKTIVGETIVVTGELKSYVNRNLTIIPFPLFDKDTNSSALEETVGSSSWQLVNNSMEDEFVLKPGETLPFRYEIRALKAGTFHLQSAFNSTEGGLSFSLLQTVTVYSNKEELNTNENSYYMLTVRNKNQVIEYNLNLGNESASLAGKRVQSTVALPEKLLLNVTLTDMNKTSFQQRLQSIGYAQFVLQGDNLQMLAYPSKFAVFVDGSKIDPDFVNIDCNWYAVRIPITSESKNIMLQGSRIAAMPYNTDAPHPRIMQPLSVVTFERGANAQEKGTDHQFEIGISTNAKICSVATLEIIQDAKRLHVFLDGFPAESPEPRFLSIAIPSKLLAGNYTVLLDGNITSFHLETLDGDLFAHDLSPGSENSEKWNLISLDYTSQAREIQILGTVAIPEFGSVAVVSIAAAVMIGVSILSRHRVKQPNAQK